MTIDHAKLAYLIHNAEYWNVAKDGSFFATQTHGGAYYEDIPVPVELVASLHPLFPVALRAVVKHFTSQAPDSHGAYGNAVADTLQCLTTGLVSFKDWNDEVRDMLSIDKLSYMQSTKRCVSITGMSVEVMYVDHNGLRIPYVLDANTRRFTANTVHLEQAYPGWEERWKIGKDLGVDNAELMKHVFSKKLEQEPSLTMTGISFD